MKSDMISQGRQECPYTQTTYSRREQIIPVYGIPGAEFWFPLIDGGNRRDDAATTGIYGKHRWRVCVLYREHLIRRERYSEVASMQV